MTGLFDAPEDPALPIKQRPDQREHRLSHFVDALLDRILAEPCWFSAVDHSGAALGRTDQAQMVWRQRQAAMGIKNSHLDWFIFQAPVYAQFELKVGSGRPTIGQETTMRLLRDRDIPTGCAWTVRQFYELLVQAGFRLHGNAENIVREIEVRYEAAQDAADVKRGAPPKARVYRKPKVKPSKAHLRKVSEGRWF